jgi:hypothetical protein
MKMLGRVAVGRLITATDMTAGSANAQMQPWIAQLQAFFPPGSAGNNVVNSPANACSLVPFILNVCSSSMVACGQGQSGIRRTRCKLSWQHRYGRKHREKLYDQWGVIAEQGWRQQPRHQIPWIEAAFCERPDDSVEADEAVNRKRKPPPQNQQYAGCGQAGSGDRIIPGASENGEPCAGARKVETKQSRLHLRSPVEKAASAIWTIRERLVAELARAAF